MLADPWLRPGKARAVAPILALNGESLTLPQNIFPFCGLWPSGTPTHAVTVLLLIVKLDRPLAWLGHYFLVFFFIISLTLGFSVAFSPSF